MDFNSDLLLGKGLIFLYSEKWQSPVVSNFSEIVHENNLCIYNKQWIFLPGKFGKFIGATRFSTVIDIGAAKNAYSTVGINNNSGGKGWFELNFFWTEIGSGKDFIAHLCDQLNSRCSGIIYYRFKKNNRIKKLISCNDATTFMRKRRAYETEANISFLQTAAARDFYLPTYNLQMAFAQCVGEMALLMAQAPVAASSPFRPVMERIQTCAQLEQRRIYASREGTKTGLLTWAWLTASRLLSDTFDANAMQAFEWSEGPHLAVIDIVVSAETESMVWADLAGRLYPKEDIWILCEANGNTYFKKWPKDQRHELLTHTQARAGIAFGTWKKISVEAS